MRETVNRSRGVDLALLEFCVEELYWSDESELAKSANSFNTVLNAQPKLVQNYAQILVRLMILGLSTQVSTASVRTPGFRGDSWKKNLKKMFTKCQLEFSLIDSTLFTV